MSKLQNTPGPWVIDYSGTEGHIKSVVPEISKVRTPTVCIYRNWALDEILTEQEIEANARLITAAPEMLDALIMVKKYGHSGYVEGSKSDIEFWFKIDRTIEKATGMSIEEILK